MKKKFWLLGIMYAWDSGLIVLAAATRKVLESGHWGVHHGCHGRRLCQQGLLSFRIERFRATPKVILLFLGDIAGTFQILQREGKMEFKKSIDYCVNPDNN